MKFVVEVDVDDQPNAVGEHLRQAFFKTKKNQVGCYNSFDWANGVESLPSIPVCTDDEPIAEDHDDVTWSSVFEDLKWVRGKKDGIECRYFWDGDGALAFQLPDGRWLLNDDCKKGYDWEIINDLDSEY